MRTCSVIIPLSAGAQVSPSFVIDLNEALSQMRGRQHRDVCITFPAGYSSLLGPFRKLYEGANPVHYQLDGKASVVSCINKGIAHALENKCDAIVVIPGSIIAPETLSSLHSVGHSADNFGIVSARVYRNTDNRTVDEQEALYLHFLEQSRHYYEWQESKSPSPFCFFLSLELLQECPTLCTSCEYLNDALSLYIKSACERGFRSLLHNKTFHAFPLAAREYLYVAPPQHGEPSLIMEENAPANLIKELVPQSVLKERFEELRKTQVSSRPSMVVDLRKLPDHASPSHDFGIHIAAAAHSRLTWSTTLLVPSHKNAELWSLPSKFPKAEIIAGAPNRCYDYSLYPTYPDSLSEIASFIALSPNPFFLLQDPFSRIRTNELQNDALTRIIASIAQGILLIGSSSEGRLKAHVRHHRMGPIHSLLPSQYSKDYPRNQLDDAGKDGQSVLVCLPSVTPNFLSSLLNQIQATLGSTKTRFLGNAPVASENVVSLPYKKLRINEVNAELASALIVVFPFLSEDLLIYLARALSLGKIVIAPKNELAQDFRDRWHGPRNLMLVPTYDEFPSVIRSFVAESERMRFIATYSSERAGNNSCSRWSQIGSAVNEFIISSSSKSPVTSEEFITKQSLISDLIYSTFHSYEHQLSEAENSLTEARLLIMELEERVKRLETAQVLLGTKPEISKKHAFLEAFSSLQGWGSRPK